MMDPNTFTTGNFAPAAPQTTDSARPEPGRRERAPTAPRIAKAPEPEIPFHWQADGAGDFRA